MTEELVRLHVVQSSAGGLHPQFRILGPASKSRESGQGAQGSSGSPRLAHLDVTRNELPFRVFAGQHANHLARANGARYPIEANRCGAQQRLGAAGVDSESPGRVADTEFEHLDPKSPGGPEVSQLVHYHQEQQHRHERCHRDNPRVHSSGPRGRLIHPAAHDLGSAQVGPAVCLYYSIKIG